MLSPPILLGVVVLKHGEWPKSFGACATPDDSSWFAIVPIFGTTEKPTCRYS